MFADLGATMASVKDKHPYFYTYRAEDILSWTYGSDNKLSAVLLRRHVYEVDDVTELPDEMTVSYRYIRKTVEGVLIEDYEDNTAIPYAHWVLPISEIPFIIIETNISLMAEIANYQIALLNMASSDINYVTKSNFPFYTEQYDPKSELAEYLRTARMASTADTSTVSGNGAAPSEGQASDAEVAKAREVVIGAAQGRRYGINLDRPEFIHPSPEPLKASMEKQEAMKKDIRQLVSLSLANLRPKMESAESKEMDQEGLISGLAYLAVILEKAEREAADMWHIYENVKNDVIISYPREFALMSETERSKQVQEKAKAMHLVPSKTSQKEIAKDIALIMLGHKTDPTTMDKILKEIDDATIMNIDPEFIIKAAEAALVSAETASVTIGFPSGEAEKAKTEKAEALAQIAASQTKGQGPVQGVTQSKQQAKDMKKMSQDGMRNNPMNNKDKTRGEGQ